MMFINKSPNLEIVQTMYACNVIVRFVPGFPQKLKNTFHDFSMIFHNIQLLTNEALDMMWYRPDNTNIDRGEAEVNIGILWSISHHIQCLISQ